MKNRDKKRHYQNTRTEVVEMINLYDKQSGYVSYKLSSGLSFGISVAELQSMFNGFSHPQDLVGKRIIVEDLPDSTFRLIGVDGRFSKGNTIFKTKGQTKIKTTVRKQFAALMGEQEQFAKTPRAKRKFAMVSPERAVMKHWPYISQAIWDIWDKVDIAIRAETGIEQGSDAEKIRYLGLVEKEILAKMSNAVAELGY